MSGKSIEEILIEKLSKEELHDLVTKYDEGTLEVSKIISKDAQNYPDEYVWPDIALDGDER